MTKFLILGDAHGRRPRIHYKGFDAILATGDFCSDAPRKYMFQAIRIAQEQSEPGLEWYDLVGRKKAREMIEKSIFDGRKVLKRLNSLGVPIYVVPGNWDWTGEDSSWAYLRRDRFSRMLKGLPNIIDVHGKMADCGEHAIIGYGISSGPEYPQSKAAQKALGAHLKARKKEYLYNLQGLSKLFCRAKKPVIFLSHNVPYNTPLDKITDKGSPRYGFHYGSVIVRELIKRHQPPVSVGGHMHEHHAGYQMGKTIAINAGFGPMANTLLEITGKMVKRPAFYR